VAKFILLNSTVYFFGVFLGLTALVFFGDLVAFFAGLAASFLTIDCTAAFLFNVKYSLTFPPFFFGPLWPNLFFS
jgi:hypothetical protein